jgi:hypothetical protein
MATLTDFHPYVLPFAPQVPEVVANVAIRTAIIALARRSRMLTRTFFIDAQRGVSDYPFDVSVDSYGDKTEMNLVAVTHVCVLGVELRPLADKPCAECRTPPGFVLTGRDLINVYPTPYRDVEDGVEVTVAVAPSQSACVFPDEVFDEWGQQVGHGALAWLLRMPKQEWSNFPLAREFQRNWVVDLTSAKGYASAKRTEGGAPINPPSFVG